MVDRLTTKDYWERSYAGRAGSHLGMSGIASRPNREMLAALESVGVAGKTVLEVGAGDSLWIPFLATRYADSQFIGLDYTERGCALLRSKCSHLPNVRVVKCDMFLPTEELLGCADLVTSFGVVEHFADLGATLLAISKFARPSGVVFTSIPNLSGLLGSYVRAMDRKTYDLHYPHDLESFKGGHQTAGLELVAADYLGAINFGVASACFKSRHTFNYQLYRSAVAISMMTWWAQDRGLRVPSTRILSPMIYAISRRPK